MAAVIFDLDGTLVDSAPVIRDVANRLMREIGLPPLDLAETRRHVGNGVRVFIERALQERGRTASEAELRCLQERFERHYVDVPGGSNVPYPAVTATLHSLAAAGHRLGVCTNKPGAPTSSVLEAHGWHALFASVAAGDTLPRRKPDPAPLLYVARALDAVPVISVGDSEVDAETARRAGVPFVLFTQGYRKGPVDAMERVAEFSSYAELPAIIATVAAGAGPGRAG